MPKPFASARIPEHLNEALEKRSKDTGEGRSAIIINALAAYLGTDIKPVDDTEKRFKSLETRLSKIEAQLKQPFQTELFDNSSDKKSDNDSASKESVIKPDNNSASNIEKTEWTTKELNAIGIKSSTIDNRYKRGKLPYSKNGYIVHERLRKEMINSRAAIIWKVSKGS